jgi:hypothetical protein
VFVLVSLIRANFRVWPGWRFLVGCWLALGFFDFYSWSLCSPIARRTIVVSTGIRVRGHTLILIWYRIRCYCLNCPFGFGGSFRLFFHSIHPSINSIRSLYPNHSFTLVRVLNLRQLPCRKQPPDNYSAGSVLILQLFISFTCLGCHENISA